MPQVREWRHGGRAQDGAVSNEARVPAENAPIGLPAQQLPNTPDGGAQRADVPLGIRDQDELRRHRGSTRHGSKDNRLAMCFDLLGRLTDAEVARRAGVSIRTVSTYRARHNIPAYAGPRKPSEPRMGNRSALDNLRDLLGQVPDHVIATRAHMSVGAVRNYRVKYDIAAAGRMNATEVQRVLDAWTLRRQLAARQHATPNPVAWRVEIDGMPGGVVLASDIRQAIDAAIVAAGGHSDRVLSVARAGAMLLPTGGARR